MPFRYKFDIMQRLNEKGYSSYLIAKKKYLSQSTITKFNQGKTNLTLDNLRNVCKLLNCQLSDFIEYVPDEMDVGIKTKTIPFFYIPLSAGEGIEIPYDYKTDKQIVIEDNYITSKADFAILIKGDSMLPQYSDGDIALIRKQDYLEINNIGAFNIDQKGYIKKFIGYNNKLVSLNSQYPDIELDEYGSNRIIGKVVGTIDYDDIIDTIDIY